MTGKERITRILKHQDADRIGLFEHFGPDTYAEYYGQGHIKEGQEFGDAFGLDISLYWPFNLTLDLDHEPEIISEDLNTQTTNNKSMQN